MQLLGTIPSYDRAVISVARKPLDDCRLPTVGNSAALDSFVGVFTRTVSKRAGGACALERLLGRWDTSGRVQRHQPGDRTALGSVWSHSGVQVVMFYYFNSCFCENDRLVTYLRTMWMSYFVKCLLKSFAYFSARSSVFS